MKIYILSIFVFCGMLFTSCENFLDQSPGNHTDADKLYDTEDGFRSSLIGCYIKMNDRTIYGRNLTITAIEQMAQHWETEQQWFAETQLKDLDFSTDYAVDLFANIYEKLYNVIVQSNDILDNLSQKGGQAIRSEQVRNIIEAEALSIRAFCHFDILRLFGQMPANPVRKVDLPYAETVGIESIPYYGFDEFAGLIIRDLKRAETLFSQSDPLGEYTFYQTDAGFNGDEFLAYRRFRFNLFAVRALMARVSLYTGDRTAAFGYSTGVIDAVNTAGQTMIDLSVLDPLNPSANDLGDKYYDLPRECLFALSAPKVQSMARELFGATRYMIKKSDFDMMFEPSDMSSDTRYLYVWNTDQYTSTNQRVCTPRKYFGDEEIPSGEIKPYNQVIPILRLSEMYLIAIETATDNVRANTLYRNYKASRNVNVTVDLTAAELAEEVGKEYRREFYAEGHMFYYYKRTGATAMMWQAGSTPQLTESNYIVPLPSSEYNANKK